MSNSSQKDNKPSAAKAEASKSRASARTPPGVAFPQMAPPPELIALQRVMQGFGETDSPLQRQEADASTNATGLPDGLKTGVERLSGVSLDDVRVHYDSDKPAQVGALAYTQGTEIHVGPGKESSVPHEAWHAVQQLQGRVEPNVQFKGKVPGNDDKGLEDEADRMGARGLELSEQDVAPTGSLSRSTNARPVVQRDGEGDGDAEPAPKAEAEADADAEKGEDAEPVDVSAVKPEQKQTFEEFVEALCNIPPAKYAELIPALDEESTRLWLLKLRSDEPEVMQLALDTEWGFQLADKIISKPKNPIPNYLAIVNHVNLGALIPTKLGGAIQFLVVTIPHIVISGILNAIPSLVGHFMESNPFFAAAIQGRYGVAINASEWSSQEMRNVWNSFKRVPREHILGQVTHLQRSGGVESSYSDHKILMSKLIPQSISMGGAENAIRPFSKFLMKRSKYSQRMRSKNAFSMTTLHEVGHAVDSKLGIMRAHGKSQAFGGWESTTPNEIFTKWWKGAPQENQVVYSQETNRLQGDLVAVQDELRVATTDSHSNDRAKRRLKEDAQNRRDMVRDQYNAARKRDEDQHWMNRVAIPRSLYDNLGEKLASGQSVKQIVEEFVPLPAQNDEAARARRTALIEKIRALPPTQMVKHGRLSNMAWTVERAKGLRMAAPFGEKMFHEAYSKDWFGYDIKAKNTGVSHYQFRAPGEFFAELYAHYYLDTLASEDGSERHPLYEFIEKNVAAKPEVAPQAMVEHGEVAPVGPNLLEGNVQVPVPQVAVQLEHGDEQAAPEQAPLDQQPAPAPTGVSQEKPKEEATV